MSRDRSFAALCTGTIPTTMDCCVEALLTYLFVSCIVVFSVAVGALRDTGMELVYFLK